jgi:hypothetical protein
MKRIFSLFAILFLSINLVAMQPGQQDTLLVHIDDFFKKELPTKFPGFFIADINKPLVVSRPDDPAQKKVADSINIGQYFGGELRFAGSTLDYKRVLDAIDDFLKVQYAENPGLTSTRIDETVQDVTKLGLSPLIVNVYQNPLKYLNYRIAFYDNRVYQDIGPRSKEKNSVDVYYLPMGMILSNK